MAAGRLGCCCVVARKPRCPFSSFSGNELRHQTAAATGLEPFDPIKNEPEASSFDVIIDAVGGKITRASAALRRAGGVIMHIGLQDNDGDLMFGASTQDYIYRDLHLRRSAFARR